MVDGSEEGDSRWCTLEDCTLAGIEARDELIRKESCRLQGVLGSCIRYLYVEGGIEQSWT